LKSNQILGQWVLAPKLARKRSFSLCQAFCQDFFWQIKKRGLQAFIPQKPLPRFLGKKLFISLTSVSVFLYADAGSVYITYMRESDTGTDIK
jgi:hypothetical protein